MWPSNETGKVVESIHSGPLPVARIDQLSADGFGHRTEMKSHRPEVFERSLLSFPLQCMRDLLSEAIRSTVGQPTAELRRQTVHLHDDLVS